MAALTIFGGDDDLAAFDQLAEDLAAATWCSVGEARAALSAALRAGPAHPVDEELVSRAFETRTTS